MNMLQRHRQPKGAPTGGQFAATSRAEASVTLIAPGTRWEPNLAPLRVPTPTLEEARARTAARAGGPRTLSAMALDQLTDTVLTGRGVPGEVRMNNRLYRMRVAVTEQLGASTGSPRSERVLAALRDPVLAGKAHELATMTPGVYEHNAVFYLSELGRTREAVQA